MTETKALAHRPSWSDIQRIGEDFYKSGMFSDVKNAMQAIVKIQAGNELGLPPFASISGINIIQGKAVLGANLIATLIKNDPRYDYRIVKSTDEICEIKFYENGAEIGTSSFTIKEAQTAGLTGKDNWKKYTSDMLFARAISRGSRRHTPGIFGGAPVYTPDELGADTDPDGYVDTTFTEDTKASRPVSAVLADMGFEDDQKQEQENKSVDITTNITDSSGVPYHDLETPVLSGMFNAMQKKIKAGEYTPEELPEKQRKCEEIAKIMAARRAAAAE